MGERLPYAAIEIAEPAPELRERVLSACRREVQSQLAHESLRRARFRWGYAAVVLALLLLNAAEGQRSATHIASIVTGGSQVARAPRSQPTVLVSLRTRVTLLAALLRDPNAL